MPKVNHLDEISLKIKHTLKSFKNNNTNFFYSVKRTVTNYFFQFLTKIEKLIIKDYNFFYFSPFLYKKSILYNLFRTKNYKSISNYTFYKLLFLNIKNKHIHLNFVK